MGYKLAGFDVIGGVEIDPVMMDHYRRNNSPRHSYLMGVQDFVKLPSEDLPRDLFDLDVLDGSPPCSSFSMAGSREKTWGDKKKFREGQAEQVLDNLFFDFIDVAKKLRPKVVISENVKGLIMGNARWYVKEIFSAFDHAGYDSQLFLLNASRMGVPQARERTFFISRRKDISLPKVALDFSEPQITIKNAFIGLPDDSSEMADGSVKSRWKKALRGGYAKTDEGNTFGFIYRSSPNSPAATITASPRVYHWKYPRRFNLAEVRRAQSFPEDYDFGSDALSVGHYVCGMSVPPFMMQRVADQIAKQLFRK